MTWNKCELIGHYGSDEAHALSAWTSTSRDLDAAKRDRIPALLAMLARDGHHTPFEKSALHFLVTVDTATHIHLLKHRIGVSINGESARYKELRDDKGIVPLDWSEEEQERLDAYTQNAFKEYHACIERLVSQGHSRKRAKESARFYLPYATQIVMDVQFNWRSFHHFLSLRMKEAAQREVHALAKMMLWQVASIEGNPFKHTIAAFGYDQYCENATD